MAREYKTNWKYGDPVTEEELNRMEQNAKELEEELTPIIEANTILEKSDTGSALFTADYTICKIGRVVIFSIDILNYSEPEFSKELKIDIPKPKIYKQVSYAAHTNADSDIYGGYLYLDTDGTLTLYCPTGLVGLSDFTNMTMIYEVGEEEV